MDDLVPKTREEIRAAILATHPQLKKVITFFGEKIEIRQMKLGDILDASSEKEKQAAVINTLVSNAYIPGTDTLIFEDADAAAFKSMPFGQDFINVTEAIEELTRVDFLGRSVDSKKGA